MKRSPAPAVFESGTKFLPTTAGGGVHSDLEHYGSTSSFQVWMWT